MKTIFLPLFILVVLSIGFLVYVYYSSLELPERVATHFVANGTPDDWMSRDKHLLFIAAFSIGISWFLACIGLISRFIPARFFNLPNRDYWLSPEHMDETRLYFSRHMIWMGCLMIAFFAGVQYTIIQANQISPVKMPNELFWPLFISFLVAITIWAIALIKHFQKSS
jgi:uncharacterized membrane protein